MSQDLIGRVLPQELPTTSRWLLGDMVMHEAPVTGVRIAVLYRHAPDTVIRVAAADTVSTCHPRCTSQEMRVALHVEQRHLQQGVINGYPSIQSHFDYEREGNS